MKKIEAKRLIGELESMLGDYPGKDDYRLNRSRAIIDQITYNQTNTYLREKASTAREFLGYWFSPRKWQQWGSAERMRHLVLMDIKKLEGSLDQNFHED